MCLLSPSQLSHTHPVHVVETHTAAISVPAPENLSVWQTFSEKLKFKMLGGTGMSRTPTPSSTHTHPPLTCCGKSQPLLCACLLFTNPRCGRQSLLERTFFATLGMSVPFAPFPRSPVLPSPSMVWQPTYMHARSLETLYVVGRFSSTNEQLKCLVALAGLKPDHLPKPPHTLALQAPETHAASCMPCSLSRNPHCGKAGGFGQSRSDGSRLGRG